MTPEEFIHKNLIAELQGMKIDHFACQALADEGVRYWRESARFKKGAWADTLAYVKRRAKKAGKA